MKKVQITPGAGFQYTPQRTITWAEEFNELLKSSHSSRNELVSKLIQDGLEVQSGYNHKSKGIYIPMEGLNNEQIALLSSDHGKAILQNIINMMLGQAGGASFQMAEAAVTMETQERPKIPETKAPVKAIEEIKKEAGAPKKSEGISALSKLTLASKKTDLKS